MNRFRARAALAGAATVAVQGPSDHVTLTTATPDAQVSLGPVRSYLAGLGQPLSYPVALDTTGRVADGYGVQDQPWFVLVSASGKILWSHDGWLALSALESAAEHAAGSHG
jgi:hypothetical protein